MFLYIEKWVTKMGYVADTRCELVINPRAYVYINPRTVMGENAPIVIMKYISLS